MTAPAKIETAIETGGGTWRFPADRPLRLDSGAHLIAQAKADLPALLKTHPDAYVWIACDTATTRALSSYVRKELGVPKERVDALGYWRP